MEHEKGRKSMLPSFFTKQELGIGNILLGLRNPIPLSIPEPVPEFRKRADTKIKSTKYTPRSCSFSPPWILSHHSTQIKPKVVDEVQAPSPVTPLSFLTDISDQETKYSSKKRGRKDVSGDLQKLTERGEILKGEIEKLMNYCNQPQAQNIELNERKRKMLVRKEDKIKNESLRNSCFSMGPSGIPDLNISAEETMVI